ncbi:putative HMG box transcriptional regulator [Aspergillus undulatus]|uniref:putative HMG box transcriptional regulator n=1 Tax=Aspergillus undulatus TaxID=1810928 RepID=UPI003CCE510B
MADHRTGKTSSYRYSESLPKVNFLSLHQSRVGSRSQDPSSPANLEAPKPSSQCLSIQERHTVVERSPSSSPVKSAAVPAQRESMQWCLCQPDPKIPRPRNAFILYRQHYQGAVVAQNPGLANPEISKIIGEQWRKLPQATKDEWKALAEEEKARHQQQYPEYRYQPRRLNRDGSRNSLSSGLSHNPSGATICNRCGGRIMNPPASPESGFSRDSVSVSSSRPSHDSVMSRSYSADQGPRGIKHGSHSEHRGFRARQWEESGSVSPDSKRRRTNPHVPFRADFHRDRSPPNSPYSMPSYAGRTESLSARGLSLSHAMQAPHGLRPVKEQPQPDPTLKLPPLQTTGSMAGSATPMSAFPPESFNLEAAVKNMPLLGKIKTLAKIAPQLPLKSFREGGPGRRGPVIAIDGHDEKLARTVTEYLNNALQKEGNFQPRIFDGPGISRPKRESSAEPEDTSDKKVEYFDRISKWHHISGKIESFVRFESSRHSSEPASGNEDETRGSPKISPRTIIPRTAEMHISSPPSSSETGSETVLTPETTITNADALPVALVPQYQLTTSDAYACMMPIDDSYSVADHWNWMAAFWRGAAGPDITVYIRECDPQEIKQHGGPVEIRLQDAKVVIVRKPTNSPEELEEKVLKRLGFEIEDYLTQ